MRRDDAHRREGEREHRRLVIEEVAERELALLDEERLLDVDALVEVVLEAAQQRHATGEEEPEEQPGACIPAGE